ncbi:MAG: EF-hand domain-containing protein [Akkermansiaceae bacterium]|nr:EF-hand domain-containing protein [Akkermansiaceae bacterium]MCP5543677.1 EF-hand domain-containing protein [Akkermansiaceae bacterium]MCP5547246.1 EF-hand domain-containing protein [Akkermansiaceae bacterium]
MRFVFLAAVCVALVSCGPRIGPVVPQSDTERKMIGLLEKFDLWDLDGSGDLDLDEITRGIRSTGTDHPPESVLDFYDTNGDRRVSLAEAQQGYQRAHLADERISERRGRES